jgi:aromatic-L-amino-acid decarboxylase
MTGTYPLEPGPDAMREMGEAALEYVASFIEGLNDAPSVDLAGAGDLAVRFRGLPPASGRPFDEVLSSFGEGVAKAVEYAGPGFLAYIPGGGLYASAIAAFLAFATNRYVNLASLSPALVQIEASVVRWMADLFQFPPEAMGILTSGGSLANFSAIVTARKALLTEGFTDGTMYTSEHAHHSIVKAAMLAGFPPRNVRIVPSTKDLRIDVSALHEMVDQDRRAGLRPFCVIANAGTTNTGTVDPLVDLTGFAHERRMWIHVDAAYGGFFQLTERGRRALYGIAGADSITLDPHKGMFLPYGTGALLVRDGSALREAHRVEAHYLQDVAPEGDLPTFADYSPELSRDFRGLRIWLPLQLHGLDAFTDALDEKLDLARYVHDELKATPGFDVPWRPDLSVVPFRYEFRARDEEEGNRALLERINAGGRVFLSSTRLGDRFTLRVCILSHRTHRDRIEECVEIIRRSAAELDS